MDLRKVLEAHLEVAEIESSETKSKVQISNGLTKIKAQKERKS